MKLTTVSPEMLPHAWPIVEPWIASALARVPSDLTLDGLREICAKGEGALMLIGQPGEAPIAAGISQVRDHEDGTRSAWVLALGGAGVGARVLRDTLQTIENGARRLGCASVNFVGRPGWAALMPSYACHVSYSKRLD